MFKSNIMTALSPGQLFYHTVILDHICSMSRGGRGGGNLTGVPKDPFYFFSSNYLINKRGDIIEWFARCEEVHLVFALSGWDTISDSPVVGRISLWLAPSRWVTWSTCLTQGGERYKVTRKSEWVRYSLWLAFFSEVRIVTCLVRYG